MSRYNVQSEAYLSNLLEDSESKSTKRIIQNAISTFKAFLLANGINDQPEEMELCDLNEKLRLFFGSIKKDNKDGNTEDFKRYKKWSPPWRVT